MKTTTFSIGTTVYWMTGNFFNEGVVRDDLNKETINVLCIRINEKRANQITKINREKVVTKSKSENMEDIKKKLLFNKFKAYSANQLIAKIEKGNYANEMELGVFKEILAKRGKTEEEITAIVATSPKEKSVETPKVVKPVVEKPEPKKEEIKVEEPAKEEEKVETKEPEMKVVHKNSGNSKVVEIQPEDEEEPVKKVEEPAKEEKPRPTNKKTGVNTNKWGHRAGTKSDLIDKFFMESKGSFTTQEIFEVVSKMNKDLKMSKVKDHIRHLSTKGFILKTEGGKYEVK